MCTAPPISYSSLPRSLGMQVPSLKGFNIPQLEQSPSMIPIGLHSSTEIVDNSRPSLSRINTDTVREQMVRQDASARAIGHRHSRSLDVPSQSVSFSATDCLNSAASDSFLLPWSAESKPSHELPVSPLLGPYISQSSRKNSASASATSPLPPFMPTLPPFTSSITPPSPIFDSSEDSEADVDSEDIWDLVPYDISWGSAYYGYKDGTLPGPEGQCIFLRSPTPLKYQRTGQACEKCRERKAKCSGSRPSCARCTMRGLECVYAPDPKRAKSEDIKSESEVGASVADPRPAPSSPAGHFEVSNQGRIRRNTEYVSSSIAHSQFPFHESFDSKFGCNFSCGSHGAQVHTQSSRVALRRRHSTIGLSVSAPLISRGLGFRASREPRLARRISRNSSGAGFLGGSLDPLIAFPRDSTEDDDLSVSESNRLSYHSLLQDPGSVPAESFHTSKLDCGEGIDASHVFLQQRPTHYDAWDVQPFSRDCLGSTDRSPSLGSLPTDVQDRQSCPDSLSPITSNNSIVMYYDGFAHADAAESSQLHGTISSSNEGLMDSSTAEGDYDMSDMAHFGLMFGGENAHWSYDPSAQQKLGTVNFPMETDAPHIAILSHSPDFYHFNANDDAAAWVPSDYC